MSGKIEKFNTISKAVEFINSNNLEHFKIFPISSERKALGVFSPGQYAVIYKK